MSPQVRLYRTQTQTHAQTHVFILCSKGKTQRHSLPDSWCMSLKTGVGAGVWGGGRRGRSVSIWKWQIIQNAAHFFLWTSQLSSRRFSFGNWCRHWSGWSSVSIFFPGSINGCTLVENQSHWVEYSRRGVQVRSLYPSIHHCMIIAAQAVYLWGTLRLCGSAWCFEHLAVLWRTWDFGFTFGENSGLEEGESALHDYCSPLYEVQAGPLLCLYYSISAVICLFN